MPRRRGSDPPAPEVCVELVQYAARLRQQSRFLHRRSDHLRNRSNDLLTIARFRREVIVAAADRPPGHLSLVS